MSNRPAPPDITDECVICPHMRGRHFGIGGYLPNEGARCSECDCIGYHKPLYGGGTSAAERFEAKQETRHVEREMGPDLAAAVREYIAALADVMGRDGDHTLRYYGSSEAERQRLVAALGEMKRIAGPLPTYPEQR